MYFFLPITLLYASIFSQQNSVLVLTLVVSTLLALIPKIEFVSAYKKADCEVHQQQELSTKLSIEQLQHYAQTITVKVMSRDVLGSGILIEKKGDTYTVLTNAHVLRAGEPPYRIQTFDGQIYVANSPDVKRFEDKDLATLQFQRTGIVYKVASFGISPTVTDEVFAGGFPTERKETINKDFIFTAGQVSLLLDKALEGGYQIAYTNQIEKGMSGGPLLNRQGCVVGVNGMHAYPLWDAPLIYADGSQVDEKLHQTIVRLSWAVPISTFLQLQQQ
ncbi:MAG: serine protease [Scytonematopsis contorta HA4267-MV1]|jgi:S1-C subfamily serine protease|nr:serine protease [Scytonematopsis contorta HA4267-MV1]